MLNLNSPAVLCARVEVEAGYSVDDVDLETVYLVTSLGRVPASRAEVRDGLLWAWFDHDDAASVLAVGGALVVRVEARLGYAKLIASETVRVITSNSRSGK